MTKTGPLAQSLFPFSVACERAGGASHARWRALSQPTHTARTHSPHARRMFTPSDLAASASRLKREQAAAAAKEREKAERRAAEAARAAAAREAIEEEKRVARLAALQAEEEVRGVG